MEWESVLTTPLLVGLAVGLLVYYLQRRNENEYPPGPFTLPILGNLLQLVLSGSIIKFCETYKRKFGNAFTFEFGGNKRVVISGYDEMHQLLLKNADHTSTRSRNSLPKASREMQKYPGLFWAPYPHWKTLRSFAVVTLREEGMGKAAMEPQIMEEIEGYLQHFIEPNLETPINMYDSLPQATSNIISQMLFGRRFDYDDETFNKVTVALNEQVKSITKAAMFQNLPFSSYFLKSTKMFIASARKFFIPTMRAYIEEQKTSLDPDHPRGVIDRFLLSEGTEACYSDENGVFLSVQLYSAGAETTSTALRWGLLFMCLHPDVKKRVQSEIGEQLGWDKSVSYKDHLNMPYTDAVLLETLRMGNIVPTSLPHTLEKDMMIGGKLVPAGADLLLNMASVLRDETVFEEPDKYKPERYLTGDIALKKQRTIPFGIGRRACLGESLAKMEMFLFFVSFLQKYDVQLPSDSMATDEPVTSLINSPKPYGIIFTKKKI